MPAKPLTCIAKYDFTAWRSRTRLSQAEAASMLGISTTKMWHAERDGMAGKELSWACYGIECFLERKANEQRAAG